MGTQDCEDYNVLLQGFSRDRCSFKSAMAQARRQGSSCRSQFLSFMASDQQPYPGHLHGIPLHRLRRANCDFKSGICFLGGNTAPRLVVRMRYLMRCNRAKPENPPASQEALEEQARKQQGSSQNATPKRRQTQPETQSAGEAEAPKLRRSRQLG